MKSMMMTTIMMTTKKKGNSNMILGIDLGTSNSLASVYIDGEVKIIPTLSGGFVTPSVVNLGEDGSFYVGEIAKERKLTHPQNTADMFKRDMGTTKIFDIGNMSMKAEELSAVILKSLKADAEKYLSEEVSDVIISVPAFFNNPQREAVLRAGTLAGLNVKKIINEPTAAALAYGVQNAEDEEERAIMVLDLGGGTFDISVMEVNGNVMEVVTVCGDNKLGGGDFTKRLIKLFKDYNNIYRNFSEYEENLIWNEAQKAKHQITAEGCGTMSCVLGGVLYEYVITEAEYEAQCVDLLEKIRKLTLQAIEESAYEPSRISDIIMVGGGTKLSIVHKIMEKMIGKKIDYSVNPDEAVVRGTATYGALLNNDVNVAKIVMTDICSHYIGVRSFFSDEYDIAAAFDVIVKKNTTIPVKKTIQHYSWPATWNFQVLQSENEYGINAVELDSFTYITPELNTSDRVEVQKSIIIDSDGIIYAEAYIPANDMRYSKVVQYDGAEYTQEETNENIDEFKSMHLELHGNDENVLLMARADRLYSEMTGREREHISNCISDYEAALNSGKKAAIAQQKAILINCLEMYEGGL